MSQKASMTDPFSLHRPSSWRDLLNILAVVSRKRLDQSLFSVEIGSQPGIRVNRCREIGCNAVRFGEILIFSVTKHEAVTQLCDLSDFDDLEMVEPWRTLFRNELASWHDWYLPAKGIILDLGAGCGETARFFLNHGAEKVICVECDPIALSYLKKNFGSNERVIIIPEKIGKIKMDIEGGEWGTVIESHDSYPRFRRLYTASTTSVCIIEPQRRLSFGHFEQRLRRLITLQGAWRRKHLRMRKRTKNR